MLGSTPLAGIATIVVLTQAACERAAPSVAPAATPSARAISSIMEGRPGPPPAAAAPSDGVPSGALTRPLLLHTVAATQGPARVYPGDATTRILVPSCLVEVHDKTVTQGTYPLAGRSCREPLQQLASFGGREWLQAGPELWVRSDGGPWHRDSTLLHADHVLFPTGSTAEGLVLVVPFRQSARSDYQASSSFELQRIGASVRRKVPLPASAKANPNMPFDDFMSECFTKTRLAAPKAFQVTADARVQAFGTECNRDDHSLRSVVETWKPGTTTSTVEPLPFKRPEALIQAQVDNDRSIWALQPSQLLHFDGVAWAEVPSPPGAPSLKSFSASASGTVWVLTQANELWERKAGQPWEARTTSLALESVRTMSAEGDDGIWLSTDTSLLSTRALPTNQLCKTPCDDFWHESNRMRGVPHGD